RRGGLHGGAGAHAVRVHPAGDRGGPPRDPAVRLRHGAALRAVAGAAGAAAGAAPARAAAAAAVAAAAADVRAALLGVRPARQPERALALLVVAARACPDPARRQALEAELRRRAAALDPAALDWVRVCASPTDRPDVPKAIILKPPVSPAEKGVLYVTFEDQ